MPAPLGTFIPFGTLRSCLEDVGMCADYPSTQYVVDLGSTSLGGLPQPCIAGFLGNSTDPDKQLQPTCSGPCVEGAYCPQGSANTTFCPGGTFNPATGSTSAASCIACPRGSSCTPGAHAPESCSPGTYQDQTGQPTCKACDARSVCLGHGLIEQTASPCSQGYHFRAVESETCSVERCCHICPIGFACDGLTITRCNPGSHTTQPGQAFCTRWCAVPGGVRTRCKNAVPWHALDPKCHTCCSARPLLRPFASHSSLCGRRRDRYMALRAPHVD